MQTSLDTDVLSDIPLVIKRPADVTISVDIEEQTFTLKTDSITYNAALLDSRHVPAPLNRTDVDQPAEVVVSGQTMNLPVELANLCGAELTVSMDDNNQAITGLTDDFDDKLYFELGPDEARIVHSADVESTYPLDFLISFQRTFPDDAVVHVTVAEDGPMTLQHPIADGNGKSSSHFCLVRDSGIATRHSN